MNVITAWDRNYAKITVERHFSTYAEYEFGLIYKRIDVN